MGIEGDTSIDEEDGNKKSNGLYVAGKDLNDLLGLSDRFTQMKREENAYKRYFQNRAREVLEKGN